MRVKLYLALVAVVAVAVQGCMTGPAGTIAGLRKEQPYGEARAVLIQSGWKPVHHPRSEASERCGARSEICSSYREAESCSSTGRAYCVFNFADGKEALSVTTVGEELTDLTVRSWTIGKR